MLRELYQNLLKHYCKRTFLFWQRLGIHVVQRHFYEPIPDTRTLDDSIWENHSELVGLDINERVQLDLLARFKTAFKNEYDQFPMEKTDKQQEYYVHNGMFGPVDGEILYCMLRDIKPKRVIEIGSGYSTLLISKALSVNRSDCDYACDYVVVDPFPNGTVKDGLPHLSRLEKKPVQKIPFSEFERLEENDMLLIDSSHVVAIGSDVQYLFLEVLPRLKKGVYISFHDIFLPAEYRKKWVLKEHVFWNEQYLLQAFLAFNNSFEILWAGSYMHINHSNELKTAFSSYDPQPRWPGGFWVRKIK